MTDANLSTKIKTKHFVKQSLILVKLNLAFYVHSEMLSSSSNHCDKLKSSSNKLVRAMLPSDYPSVGFFIRVLLVVLVEASVTSRRYVGVNGMFSQLVKLLFSGLVIE